MYGCTTRCYTEYGYIRVSDSGVPRGVKRRGNVAQTAVPAPRRKEECGTNSCPSTKEEEEDVAQTAVPGP